MKKMKMNSRRKVQLDNKIKTWSCISVQLQIMKQYRCGRKQVKYIRNENVEMYKCTGGQISDGNEITVEV